MGSTAAANGRHYRKGHQVTHREDLTHEYKGHRCISVYNLPPHMTSSDPSADLRRTKSAVSASVAGMLNTGVGGTIYLGVDDGGRVVGLPLTRQQQHHILASLSWTLARFTPAVHPDRYCVNFVPVLAPSRPAPPRHAATPPRPAPPPSAVESGAEGGVDAPHHVATPRPCWCDKEARRQATAPPEWVVEIHLRPWDLSSQERFLPPPQEPPKPPLPPLPPLHLTEANVCYYRHGSRQITLSVDDIRRLLVHRTQHYYTRRLAMMSTYLGELQVKVRELGLGGKQEGKEGYGCGREKRREDVEDREVGGKIEGSGCREKRDGVEYREGRKVERSWCGEDKREGAEDEGIGGKVEGSGCGEKREDVEDRGGEKVEGSVFEEKQREGVEGREEKRRDVEGKGGKEVDVEGREEEEGCRG